MQGSIVRRTEQFIENLRNYAAGRPMRHVVDRRREY